MDSNFIEVFDKNKGNEVWLNLQNIQYINPYIFTDGRIELRIYYTNYYVNICISKEDYEKIKAYINLQ